MRSAEFVLVGVLLVDAIVGASAAGVVTTAYGKLNGVRYKIGDKSHVDVFLGVPYGQAPLREQRFMVRCDARGWSGTN